MRVKVKIQDAIENLLDRVSEIEAQIDQSDQSENAADNGGLIFNESDGVEIRNHRGVVGYLLSGRDTVDMRARFLTKSQLLAIARRMEG